MGSDQSSEEMQCEKQKLKEEKYREDLGEACLAIYSPWVRLNRKSGSSQKLGR